MAKFFASVVGIQYFDGEMSKIDSLVLTLISFLRLVGHLWGVTVWSPDITLAVELSNGISS